MLKEAKLSIEFWDKAIEVDTYQRNRISKGPKTDTIYISPEQAYTGNKPDISYIRVWGSKCYSYVNPKTLPSKGRKDKLIDRGRSGVFIGYTDTTT